MFGLVRPSCFAILFFPLVLTVTVWAQTSIDDVHVGMRTRGITLATPETARGVHLIRSSVDLVTVPVTITDAFNRPVVGLDQGNFQVFENKKLQEIRHFSTDDAPVSIGIILDTSGSMANKLDRARDAVRAFCEVSNPQDEFFMITFSEAPHLASDFTYRPEELENGLLTVQSRGRTALLDAIYMGLHKMRQARYPRRALLVLSDGGDNHSRYSERDVKNAAREADVLMYAVGIFDTYFNTEEEMLGPGLLRSMTNLTGGQAFALSSFADLPSITRLIGNQLRYQYMLAYRPPTDTKDGKWHKISVRLRLPKSIHALLHVNARPGYYAAQQ